MSSFGEEDDFYSGFHSFQQRWSHKHDQEYSDSSRENGQNEEKKTVQMLLSHQCCRGNGARVRREQARCQHRHTRRAALWLARSIIDGPWRHHAWRSIRGARPERRCGFTLRVPREGDASATSDLCWPQSPDTPPTGLRVLWTETEQLIGGDKRHSFMNSD